MTPEQDVPEMQSHQGAPPVQQQDASGQNDGPDGNQDGNQSSADGGQGVPHGMGQSKSSRRRRRKRKHKGATASPAPAEASVDGQPGQPIAVQAQASAAVPQAPSQQQGGQQQGSGGKRWKKKYRDRQRQQADPNPGNNFSAGNGGGYSQNSNNYGNGSGFKRKGGKQRKDRSFVGPMDHSYRAVNGNFADSPPATIEIHGNHHGRGNGHGGPRHTGDSQPIDYSQGRTVPIPEGAPTKIYFFIEDLFFLAKIQETARKLGVKIAFIKNDKEKDIVAELDEMDDDNRPALIVFDLNNANAKPLTLIPRLKSKLKRGTSIIGFLSHLQGDLKAKAVEAGCDTVMPRSAFSQNLPNLLRRYGIIDEDEPNFNQ